MFPSRRRGWSFGIPWAKSRNKDDVKHFHIVTPSLDTEEEASPDTEVVEESLLADEGRRKLCQTVLPLGPVPRDNRIWASRGAEY